MHNIRNIYLLGDLHFGIKNSSTEWFEIQKSFLLDWFFKKIDEDGFDPEQDILIQAGDWNHTREFTNVRIQNESLEIFKILSAKFKRGIHIILGNHDVYYKDRNDIHSLKGIDTIFTNIKIYESPQVLNINGIHKFLMLPWEHDLEVLKQQIQSNRSKADYIICHADIKDFKLIGNVKVEHGIDTSVLKNYKKIYSGHIHIRQSKGNITYVGTPYQMDRGDFGNIKGFYKIGVAGSELEETFFENDYSPRYLKIKAEDLLNLSLEEVNKMFNNNFIDILIDDDLAKIFPISRFVDLISKSGNRSLEFLPYQKNKSIDSNGPELVDSRGYAYSLYEIAEGFLSIRELPSSLQDRSISKFKEIHSEVLNSKKIYG